METRYTRHARTRMAQRGITEPEVEEVMGRPLLNLRRQVLKGRPQGRKLTTLLSGRRGTAGVVVSAWD
jgi:Domain of unknown function (DUF4258)